VKIAEKLLLTVLIAFSVSCSKLPEYPLHFVYDIDTDAKVCGEYTLNRKTKELTWVRDLPLKQCNGHLAVRFQDALRIKGWVIDVESKWKEACK
jgi:hypothetical protein